MKNETWFAENLLRLYKYNKRLLTGNKCRQLLDGQLYGNAKIIKHNYTLSKYMIIMITM